MKEIQLTHFYHKFHKKWEREDDFVEAEHTNIRFVRHPDFREDLVYFDYLPNTPVASVRYNKWIIDVHEILPFLQDETKEKIRKAYAEMHRDVNAKE